MKTNLLLTVLAGSAVLLAGPTHAAVVLGDDATWAFSSFLTNVNPSSKGWNFGNSAANAPTVVLNGVTLVGNTGAADTATGLDVFTPGLTYGIAGFNWSGADQITARNNLSRGGTHGGTGPITFNLAAAPGETYLIELVALHAAAPVGGRSMAISIDGTEVYADWWIPQGDPYNRVLRIETVADADGIDLVLNRGTHAASDQNPALSALALTQLTGVPSEAPAIVLEPQSAQRYAGEQAALTVSASGYPPPDFQWQKDGTNVPGATSSSLIFSSLELSDAGTYVVVVTNVAGSVTSTPAALVVQPVADLTTALSGYWDFDDGAGDQLADLTSQANHGTLRNMPAWTNGFLGDALGFNGTAQWVFIPDFPKAESTLTLSAWVWAHSRPAWASIAKNWPTGGGQFHLGLDGSSGRLSCYVMQQGGPQIGPAIDSEVFPTNSWQHVAVVYDGVRMRVYRNGAEVGSVAYNGTVTNPPVRAFMSIAAKAFSNTTADSFWDGMIDDLGYWTRGLSAADIQSIYNEGLSGHSLDDVLGPRSPRIGTEPQGRTHYVGEQARFSVGAGGTRPVTYQWYRDTTPVPDATNSTLTVPNLSAADAGSYMAIITNAHGSVTSAPAALVVQPVPDITAGLAGYWNFDEGFGDLVVDYSGNGNDGALVNFPTDDSPWVAGQIGGALNFAGALSSNYVAVPDYPKPVSAMTLSAWVWADARPTWASIAKNWPDGGGHQFHFGLDTAGQLNNYLTQEDQNEASITEPVLFPTNAWQHVAVVLDGAQMTLYRNGVAAGSVAYDGTINTSNLHPALGIGVKLGTNGLPADGSPGYWQGKIDDLGLWTRGLTPEEILAIYIVGLSGNPLSDAVPGVVAPTLSASPEDQSQPEGGTAVFNVTAAGTPPLSYQWLKDDTALSGANDATLTIDYLCVDDAGAYSVVVCNAAGCVTSSPPAQLTITAAPAITNDLAGYWRFDETSGAVAADSSGYGNAGQLMNFPGDDSQWVPGIVGGSLNFRGPEARDYVVVADYPKPATTLTLSAWVWADARPTWATIIKNWPTGGQFHLGLNSTDGRLSCYLRQADNAQVGPAVDPEIFPVGSWQHVATVYDGTHMIVYRNGIPVGSAPYDGTILTALASPALGIGVKLATDGTPPAGTDAGYWQGKLDEVALWTRGLAPSEIRAIHHAGLEGQDLTAAGGPPALRVSREGPEVTISWPLAGRCFTLESAPALLSTDWTPVTATPAVAGERYVITVTATSGNQFYRLKKP